MYKNVIFDVGEVLLTYDWKGALEKAGVPSDMAPELSKLMLHEDAWKELDRGVMPYEEVVELICSKHSEYADAIRVYLMDVDNLPIARPKVWEEVHKLKEKGYKLYILSNYSDYMFERHTKDRPFIKDMDGIMVSYMVHINKPDPGIYLALLEKYDLKAKECIYFDDREDNTEAARRLGIDAITVTGEKMLISELEKL